ENGKDSFYKIKEGKSFYYDINSKEYKIIPGTADLGSIEHLRATKTIWKNAETSLIDLGDGFLNQEFHSKMNTIGGTVLEGINKAIDLAEKEYKGLVVSNNGENFSAGANVGLIFMMAVEQEYDELDFAIRQFQQTMMRIRYSSIPVVAA